MNTLIISTFTCTFEVFEKFVADFHEKEGNKYIKEEEYITFISKDISTLTRLIGI